MKMPTLEEAEDEIRTISSRLGLLKSYVNSLYALNGQEGPYSAEGPAVFSAPAVQKPKQAPDEFLGKPFAMSARLILERKKAANPEQGPMSADEIYDALKSGGYGFDVNGADAQKNGVKIALGKNSQTFTRIPNSDLFGLVEWYGGVRAKRPARKASDVSAPDVANEDSKENEGADNLPAEDIQDADAA